MSRSEEFDRREYDEETGRPKMYHGTAHDFHYDMVLPRTALAHRSKWDDFYQGNDEWRKDRVFASTSERGAWTWAQGPGRPRVHEVHVQDPKGGSGGEFHGEYAMVKGTRWTPPPIMHMPGSHVQGTLPPVDWAGYGGANWKTYTGEEHLDRPEPQRNLNSQQFAGQGSLL